MLFQSIYALQIPLLNIDIDLSELPVIKQARPHQVNVVESGYITMRKNHAKVQYNPSYLTTLRHHIQLIEGLKKWGCFNF